MSFLDNLKKKDVGVSVTPTPKVNPLAPKVNPLAPKINPLAKQAEVVGQVEITEQTEVSKKTLPILAKKDLSSNPLLKKKVELKTESMPEVTEEKEAEKVTSIVADMKEAEKEVTDTTTVTETTEAVTKIAEQQTTAPKGRGGRRSSAKSKDEAKVDQPEDEVSETIIMPTTHISFSNAMIGISSPFVDSEWESYKEDIQKDLDGIIIEDDMNPATLKTAISKLAKVRDKVWNNYQSMKSQYEALSLKEPEGLIERVKKISLAGNNDLERKKAGVEACMSFTDREGDIVNLYELMDEIRSRYYFLRGILESVEFKRNSLITMNGALKIEQSLTTLS